LKFIFLVDSPYLNGSFTKVGGIQEDIEVLTQRDGQNPQQVRKMPGTFNGGELKLERGVVKEATKLIEWFSTVKRCGRSTLSSSGQITIEKAIRSDVKITALRCNVDGPNTYQAVRVINLLNAWPRRYQMADLDALSSDFEFENITLAFEELQIEDSEILINNSTSGSHNQPNITPPTGGGRFGLVGFAP
jgi:phage tail-like protein